MIRYQFVSFTHVIKYVNKVHFSTLTHADPFVIKALILYAQDNTSKVTV